MTLRLGPDLTLPLSIASESIALLAKKGAGKSNAAVVLAEQMYAAGIPWVAIDPKGDWYGIRSAGPGGDGLPIPILGGLHGDVPLEETSGAMVADLIVDANLTCVLDLSEFPSNAATARFLTAFAERLYRRHGKAGTVRHLFLEEADEYLPQRVPANLMPCVGIWSKLVRRGRQRGLGVTLISQRSAVVNKDALTQTEILIALRTTSPQDRKAIAGWVDYHDAAREIVDSLPTLGDGEAWVVSAHHLGIVGRYQFNRRSTLDTGGTPTFGSAGPVASLVDLDLDELRRAMADTVERAADSDPKVLRARLAAAETRIAELETRSPGIVHIPVPAVDPADLEAIDKAKSALWDVFRQLSDLVNPELDDRFASLERALWAAADASGHTLASDPDRPSPAEPGPLRWVTPPDFTPTDQANAAALEAVRSAAAAVVESGGICAPLPGPFDELPGGARKMAEVLVSFVGTADLTRAQLGALSGYTATGGTFGKYLGMLFRDGWAENHGDRLAATRKAFDTLGPRPPLSRGEVLERWRASLGATDDAGPRKMFNALLAAHPEPMTRDQLGAAAGYEPAGGTFGKYLGILAKVGLVHRGDVIALTDAPFLGV